ncbi:fungal-specific transcription factor domain-containing protein [Phyllosticta capitalensis]
MGEPMPIVEIGSLRTLSSDESSFIGSSTGICFVNTVRNAFKASKDQPASFQDLHDAPLDPVHDKTSPLEEFLLGDGANSTPPSPARPTPAASQVAPSIPRGPSYVAAPPGIGRPPDAATSKQLLVLYFKLWHPLFPFIHGPTFLQEIEVLYDPTKPLPFPEEDEPDRHRCCRAIIAQCVFNIAQAGTSKEILPRYARIESANSLIFSLSSLSTKQDLHSLQALFAAQLYFITKGSFRSASAIGGLLVKSIFHSGLHRCPNRYTQLTDRDRDLRKRLFWSAYVVDRYVSQGLGIPLGFQDSDIDVCFPGQEHHRLARQNTADSTPQSGSAPLATSAIQYNMDQRPMCDQTSMENMARSYQEEHRDVVLAGLVGYSRLTGRAVELFHKSIHVRSVDHSKILYITADIHAWWNSLPPKLVSTDYVRIPNGEPSAEIPPSFVPLFTVLYQQLLFLVNRPCLSLPSTCPEFAASLQICITASRTVVKALEMQLALRQPFFLPELLSAAWMAGLILVFACQLKFYPDEKGFTDIGRVLALLRLMAGHWNTARNYYKALSNLVADLKSGTARRSTPPQNKRGPDSEETNNAKRNKYSTSYQGNGYFNTDLTPPESIHQAVTGHHPSNGDHQHQTSRSTPQQSNFGLINNNDFNTADGHMDINNQQNMFSISTPASTTAPQGVPGPPTTLSMPFQSSSTPQFTFSPPALSFDTPQWPEQNMYAEPTLPAFTETQMLQSQLDPWLGDPTVNSLDIFGQVTWGSLNADYAYNPYAEREI